MKDEFLQILEYHRKRYPLMLPQDYGKLAYQSAMGSEHLVTQAQPVLERILQELRTLPPKGDTALEPIGNGLCRFPLSLLGEGDAALLARLFIRTAQEHPSSWTQLEGHLAVLSQFPVEGLRPWVEQYLRHGCPALSHSELYRQQYSPHYRLLAAEYGVFFPVLSLVQRWITQGEPRVLAIDGRCGSGKTTLGQLLGKLFGCRVFHLDDFYLPMARRAVDWPDQVAGNMDLERFIQEVLLPVQAGQEVAYRRYRCSRGEYLPTEMVPPTPVTVIEGSYSHHPSLRKFYHSTVFLTCSSKQQQERLHRREGEDISGFLTRWIPMEERYYAAYDIPQQAELVLDTDLLSIPKLT